MILPNRERLQPMTSSAKFRVVIDMQPDGDFLVYSDPEVEVICRCAGSLDDLYRLNHYAIPEGWLGKRVGFMGDGSLTELVAIAHVRAEEADEPPRPN
jgi:hypothetical protein